MQKRILCFGDSNTWGYDPITGQRFPENIRWTSILQNILGEEYVIIEEGLCGRTTVFEDPLNEGLCGFSYLTPCMMSQAPIDYLIIMLGTNDCKERYSATPKNIADGLKRLIIKARQLREAWREKAKILVIAPGPIEKECEISLFAGEMGVCSDKSKCLAEEYKKIADFCGCDFLDAGQFVTMNKVDYMHLDAASHKSLAVHLAELIKNKFAEA